MTVNNLAEELTVKQAEVSSVIFSLVIGRVLKIAHSRLSGKDQKNMENIFSSSDQEAQKDFIKKNVPDFSDIFKEEFKKVEEEIKTAIENDLK